MRSFAPLKLAIAAAFFLMIGGLTVLFLHGPASQSQLPLLADAIESAHMRFFQPDHLMDVSASPLTSTPSNPAPPANSFTLRWSCNLASDGFPLVGGRLDIINHQPVAALIYHRNKHTINLFIWPENSPESAAAAIEPLTTPAKWFSHLLHWTDHSMTFWAASDLNEEELSTFATLFRSATAAK